MEKFSRLLAFISIALTVCVLSSCTGGANADKAYVGKWVSVTGEAMGITLTGEDIGGFALDLQEGGKAVLTVDGESESVKWQNEEEILTVSANGTDMTGTVKGDTIVFDDMLNMGLKLTFAKEGTDAAKPENYLPEADKGMLGTWQSNRVTDILGDDVDAYAADALKLEFTAEHTVNIALNGEETNGKKWSLIGDDWGSVDDVNMNWDITQDGIDVNYTIDDEYYVFHCVKN